VTVSLLCEIERLSPQTTTMPPRAKKTVGPAVIPDAVPGAKVGILNSPTNCMSDGEVGYQQSSSAQTRCPSESKGGRPFTGNSSHRRTWPDTSPIYGSSASKTRPQRRCIRCPTRAFLLRQAHHRTHKHRTGQMESAPRILEGQGAHQTTH
jgi:hypothetical protein